LAFLSPLICNLTLILPDFIEYILSFVPFIYYLPFLWLFKGEIKKSEPYNFSPTKWEKSTLVLDFFHLRSGRNGTLQLKMSNVET